MKELTKIIIVCSVIIVVLFLVQVFLLTDVRSEKSVVCFNPECELLRSEVGYRWVWYLNNRVGLLECQLNATEDCNLGYENYWINLVNTSLDWWQSKAVEYEQQCDRARCDTRLEVIRN